MTYIFFRGPLILIIDFLYRGRASDSSRHRHCGRRYNRDTDGAPGEEREARGSHNQLRERRFRPGGRERALHSRIRGDVGEGPGVPWCSASTPPRVDHGRAHPRQGWDGELFLSKGAATPGEKACGRRDCGDGQLEPRRDYSRGDCPDDQYRHGPAQGPDHRPEGEGVLLHGWDESVSG